MIWFVAFKRVNLCPSFNKLTSEYSSIYSFLAKYKSIDQIQIYLNLKKPIENYIFMKTIR